MAALLSSFLKDFCESFLTPPILLALAQKVRKTYLYLKCHQTKSFHPRTVKFCLDFHKTHTNRGKKQVASLNSMDAIIS